jgi:predicted flap endonuclease-1-like 5' DNA nuclease
MPAFTINQWAILFLVLLLGWLIGLVSRGGGAKWRRAYEAERDARAQEQSEHEEALAAANARIAELDRVTPAVPVAAPSATVETLDLTRDDLARIEGVGAAGERRLNAEGIYRYSDITGLSPAEESALEERMGADPGYIEQERWREQAALLQAGKDDEHRAKFS